MRHTSTQNFLQDRFFLNSSSKLMKASLTHVASKFNRGSRRSSPSRFKSLATLWSKNSTPMLGKRKQYTYTSMVRGKDISFAPSNIKRVLKLRKDPIPNAPSYQERKANKDYRLDHVLEDLSLCADAKIPAIPDDTLIPQEPPIVGVAMTRIRNPRPARQATPPQQEPPQEQPQPQFHHQQDFPSNFYSHFDASMSQIYRRLDQQQEENRKSFEAINTRMDRMDDQLSFLCYSNQMANEQMLFPYQNTSRQFKEMEMQGILVTMANLAIHRQREEEMNQERMRHDQILQEAAAQQVKEANKGKAREVVPDFEEEFVSSESEEW
ncbi:hypothetical protein PIB30_100361 [Stylosanthes scabra]|uniref:Uncharacterized protein n=1 Tax=Stylosanthes scabra TaxID=79078 RepID=A0ABU6YWS3_9FABA|nr:hypothetical protein [Stylosanthes scabra]